MIFTKNKEGVRVIRVIKHKKYAAGKYTRARAPLARNYTNRKFESKDETTSNGNRTEWSPFWSVIIRVINKIGRPRSDTKFFNQLIITLTKIKTQEIPRSFFASSEDKAIQARAG